MERECVSILSIHSFLRALRCLAHFKIPCALCVLTNFLKCLRATIYFMITLVSVLKSVDKANIFLKVVFEMCKCRKFVLFEQASNNYLLVLKKVCSFLLNL